MLDSNFDPMDPAPEWVPSDLDDMAPGPVLGAVLSAIDVENVCGYDQVVLLRAFNRMATHYQANTYRAMAALRDTMAEDSRNPVEAAESAAAEIGAALHLTRRATDAELSFALELHQRLPQLREMLLSGVIDVRRARVIDNATFHLPQAAASNIVGTIASRAPEMTTGELGAWIRKLCVDDDPQEAKERYDRSVADRRVVAQPMVEGTANLSGHNLPPDRVTAITRRINKMARSLRGGEETRTMDQLRADIYLDLLQGTCGTTAGVGSEARGVVHLTVDLDTLAGLNDHSGELNGFAPVISDITRRVAADQHDAQWQYTVTDTRTGEIHTGTTRRRPTRSQRRRIEARDRTCVFPGCRMPAIDSDIDHKKTWQEGGATTEDNLVPLCRRDHCLKHNGWIYEILDNGDCCWTSPLGHTYTSQRAPP